MALLIEPGQMTASDYMPIYPDLPLASEGASTDAILPSGVLIAFVLLLAAFPWSFLATHAGVPQEWLMAYDVVVAFSGDRRDEVAANLITLEARSNVRYDWPIGPSS